MPDFVKYNSWFPTQQKYEQVRDWILAGKPNGRLLEYNEFEIRNDIMVSRINGLRVIPKDDADPAMGFYKSCMTIIL